ncbi:MAG: hypothetical protein LQ350_008215 [Teloschistes chrysophthalmus]|nr:MAG: hypothetical protein LQ350_008215 [Niorma chrysophthalma]
MTNACVAVTQGSYGAGYGQLAYNAVIDSCRPLGNGPRPALIDTSNPDRIDGQIRAAKDMGCVALIAEIVNACDGKVINEQVWRSNLKACERYGLFVVVDEALTSIRCGAPFAYQLPQYAKHGLPDLVLFGKAIRTNGIAVEWRVVNVSKLGLRSGESREFVILDWQERLTEMAQAADLLISWGTIVLAKKEEWSQRAIEVGRILWKFIVQDGIPAEKIAGLSSLIYLEMEDSKRHSSPVMGAKAGHHVRWLPVLDKMITSEATLRKRVFGLTSLPHRRAISAYLKEQDIRLQFCSRCGSAVDVDVQPCEACVVRVCEECEPGRHICPMIP